MQNFSLIISTFLLFSTLNTFAQAEQNRGRFEDFNQNWLFSKDSALLGYENSLDEIGWRLIDLPHDLSIEDLAIQNARHVGPFFKGVKGGGDVGFVKGGVAWYRKHFKLTNEQVDKEVMLHFDGIQAESQVFINGVLAYENMNGYTPFNVRITDYLNDANEDNLIAIKVRNRDESSRWFAGFGIYRDVSISFLDPLHIRNWGVFITTPEITKNKAIVAVSVETKNNYDEQKTALLSLSIVDPNGMRLVSETKDVQVNPGESLKTDLQLMVKRPLLWGVENPRLYTVKVVLISGGAEVDRYHEKFGIRSLSFSAETGFLLNNEFFLMKGACLHHDNGILGAAAFKAAEYRRVAIMKKNGFNAIRTSHNPPSKHFLDACDELGMLVIDEINDCWEIGKRKNDYHLHFSENWEKDLENMIRRDRNHPSIIMWSYGNEVRERGMERGYEIGKFLGDKIRSIDSTRALTMGVNGFNSTSKFNWEHDLPPTFELLDVAGYNYRPNKYASDHKNFPNRVIYCSESFPKEAFSYWKKVEELPYVIGDFVWTGMDYIGESGIGISSYNEIRLKHPQPWPWFNANCGDIDLVGNKKPQSYYRDVLWDESEIEILIHEPIPEKRVEQVGKWGWPREEVSWTWPGYEGQLLQVNVYADFPEVGLYLNDELIGQKKINLDSGITASFAVPYRPGVLRAVGIGSEKSKAVKSLKTVNTDRKLVLLPESTEIIARRSEVAFVKIAEMDSDQIVPTSNRLVEVEIFGEGELIAAGTGYPLIEGSLTDESLRLFNGQGLIIVRSSGKAGKITIRVTAENGLKSEVEIAVN